MPLEPRHGQRIPDARRLAKLLARVLRAMRLHAQRQVRAGREADLRAFEPVIADAVKPLLAHEWAVGAEMGRRRVRNRTTRRVRVKAAGLTPESVGVAFDLFRPEAAAAASRLALELAGSVTRASQDAVRAAVRRGVEEGLTGDGVAALLRAEFTPERAHTIAVTEGSRAQHAGQYDAARANGVWGLKWLASADACPACEEMDGKTVRIGEPFAVDPRGGPYAVVLYPPRHPHCVLGETPVRAASLVSAMKAHYQGPVLRIDFGDRSCVAVTPNHMLLTPTGFAFAKDLVEGDDVISAPLPPVGAFPPGGGPNDDRRPPSAEEIFRAWSESRCVTTDLVPTAPEYLHGDAALVNGEISVVRSDGLLRRDGKARVAEPVGEIPFVTGEDFPSRFLRDGDLAPVFERLLFATDGAVGSLRERQALAWGQLRHADRVGLTAGSDGEPHSLQPCHNSPPANGKRLRDVQDAFPGLVSTAKVVKIQVEWSHEPVLVYDFETQESMYTIGHAGIVCSNCRCAVLDVFDAPNPRGRDVRIRH